MVPHGLCIFSHLTDFETWGSNKLTIRLLVDRSWIISGMATHGLDTGVLILPCLVETHTDNTGSCKWCQKDLGQEQHPLHFQYRTFPLGSPSQCLTCFPCSCTFPQRKEKGSHSKQREKDSFPQKVQRRGSLQRHGTKTGWGYDRRGSNWSLKHFGSLLCSSRPSLAAFKFHSLFQWDLGIELKLQL
jgi:hypothetical protein